MPVPLCLQSLCGGLGEEVVDVCEWEVVGVGDWFAGEVAVEGVDA